MPKRSRMGELSAWEWDGRPPGGLLLHGIGNYGRYWDFFADAIAGRLRLVAPDARGHGESAKPESGYAPRDFVRDAVAVMDASGLTRPIVVGHSMGGFHATALTLIHPDRVAKLVLVDVGPRIEETGNTRARRLSLERPDRFPDDPSALAYLRETSPGYSDAVYENRMRHVFAREGDGLVWRSSKDALRQIFEDSGTASVGIWRRIGEIACPVLVVRGTRSPSLSAETAREMTRAMKNARLMELDAGHNIALDRPQELADAVIEFARESAP